MMLQPGHRVTDSFGRPDPALVAAAGLRGCIRYLSLDPLKNLNGIGVDGSMAHPGELPGLLAAGLGVGVVWETTALAPLGGASLGASHARTCLSMLRALNWPTDVPVWVAFDSSFTWPLSSIARSYGRAFAAGLSGYRVGGYGGDRTVLPLIDAGVFVGLWQASARSWSDSYPAPRAHVVQLLEQQNLGTTVDINVVQQPLRLWSTAVDPPKELTMEFLRASDPTQPTPLPGGDPATWVTDGISVRWVNDGNQIPPGQTVRVVPQSTIYGYLTADGVMPTGSSLAWDVNLFGRRYLTQGTTPNLTPILGALNTVAAKLDVAASDAHLAATRSLTITGTAT